MHNGLTSERSSQRRINIAEAVTKQLAKEENVRAAQTLDWARGLAKSQLAAAEKWVLTMKANETNFVMSRIGTSQPGKLRKPDLIARRDELKKLIRFLTSALASKDEAGSK